MNIQLTNVRISYPALFKPKAYKADKDKAPKFSLDCILDPRKNAKDIEKLEDAIDEIIEEAFKGKKPKGMRVLIKDGNDKTDDDDVVKVGYEDMLYIKASSTKRIPVVDRDLSPLTEDDNKPYGGCYCNVSIRLYAQDNDYGRHVNCQLRAVQFVADGKPFGDAAVDVEKEFKRIDDDDERPRKRRRAVEDDEDEKPAKKRRRDDDDDLLGDDDERPRKKRRRDDDDDIPF